MKPILIVFCKNPVKGKVKTRLAKKIGENQTLHIYNRLIKKTFSVVKKLNQDKAIFYSDFIPKNAPWANVFEYNNLQKGKSLGERMENAFIWAFESKFNPVVIIGTDLWSLEENDINNSFNKLNSNDVVIGPSCDGGYYLLGIKESQINIFRNIPWSTNKVLKETLKKLKNKRVFLLKEKNDIDNWKDLKNCKDLFDKIDINKK